MDQTVVQSSATIRRDQRNRLHLKLHGMGMIRDAVAISRFSWNCVSCAALLCSFTWPGCASTEKLVWHDAPTQLLRSALSADSHATLEIALVTIPLHMTDRWASIWDACDEQAISVEQREQCERNGFRVGIYGSSIPPDLQAAIAENHEDAIQCVAGAGEAEGSESPSMYHQLCVRWRTRNEIVTSRVRPELTTFVRHEQGLSGYTFRQAQTVFAVTARPGRNDAVVLELHPEIQHGEMKPRYISTDGAIRLLPSREQFHLPEEILNVSLTPGQSVMVGSLGPAGSLGSAFFSHPAGQKLLLIRIVAAPTEKLYADPLRHDPQE